MDIKEYKNRLIKANILDYDKLEKKLFKRDERAYAEYLQKHYKGKKILLYSNSQHTKIVLEHIKDSDIIVGVIEQNSNDISFEPYRLFAEDELGDVEFDYITVVGQWYSNDVANLKAKLGYENIINPYAEYELRDDVKKRKQKEIDNIVLSKDKPNLVVIASRSTKDFFSKASKELAKEFNLIKIYTTHNKVNYNDNRYFSSIISLDLHYPLFEYFFSKHYVEYCCIYSLGPGDLWWFPYIKSLLHKDTKMVSATCDFHFNFGITATTEPCRELYYGGSQERLDIETYGEKYSICESDGFISNYKGIAGGIFEKYTKSYLYTHYMVENELKVFEDRDMDFENIRLCYAGVIDDKDNIEQKMINVYDIFKSLLEDGFSIDVYSMFDRVNNRYVELTKDYKFRLLESMPQKEMIETSKGYDFGIMLSNMSQDVMDHASNGLDIVTGRFVSYLMAGIPVIVSSEFGLMHDMVVEKGLGISVSHSEISTIKDKIKEIDYKQLKENVKMFQDEYIEADYGKELTDFIKSL